MLEPERLHVLRRWKSVRISSHGPGKRIMILLDRKLFPTSTRSSAVIFRMNELFPAPVAPIMATATSGPKFSLLDFWASNKACDSVACCFCSSWSIVDRRDPIWVPRTCAKSGGAILTVLNGERESVWEEKKVQSSGRGR